MKNYLIALLLLSLASFMQGVSQFSGYMSTTYGYHSNPLYNSVSTSDQIGQSYLQLGYEKEYENSILSLGYVNGLVLFNQLADRNYLEQLLTARYAIVFWKGQEEETAEDESGNEADEAQNDEADENDSIETELAHLDVDQTSSSISKAINPLISRI